MEKVRDGRYLKNYELTYQNKAGKEKKYEIVSRKELKETCDTLKYYNSSDFLLVIWRCELVSACHW